MSLSRMRTHILYIMLVYLKVVQRNEAGERGMFVHTDTNSHRVCAVLFQQVLQFDIKHTLK